MKFLHKSWILLSVMALFAVTQMNAQKFKEMKNPETGDNMLVGTVTLDKIEDMDGFENLMTEEAFQGDAKMLESITSGLQGVSIVAYIGTWCSDSQYLLPEFINLMKQAGYDVASITIIGLDNEKKTIKGEMPPDGVTLVPTFIFSKEGKELGRIEETLKHTMIKDVAAIVLPKK